MGKKRIIILSIISALLIICTYISISYGFYVISSNEQKEMETATSTPSCVGLTITDSKAFTLEADYAAPITDDQFLNSSTTTKNKYKYTFTVTNDCTDKRTLNIGVAPLDDSLLISKIKYILVDGNSTTFDKASVKNINISGNKTLTDEMKKNIQKTVGVSAQSLYNIGTVTLDNKGTKTFDLYMWVSSDAGNDVMDKSFKAAIVLDNIS